MCLWDRGTQQNWCESYFLTLLNEREFDSYSYTKPHIQTYILIVYRLIDFVFLYFSGFLVQFANLLLSSYISFCISFSFTLIHFISLQSISTFTFFLCNRTHRWDIYLLSLLACKNVLDISAIMIAIKCKTLQINQSIHMHSYIYIYIYVCVCVCVCVCVDLPGQLGQ